MATCICVRSSKMSMSEVARYVVFVNVNFLILVLSGAFRSVSKRCPQLGIGLTVAYAAQACWLLVILEYISETDGSDAAGIGSCSGMLGHWQGSVSALLDESGSSGPLALEPALAAVLLMSLAGLHALPAHRKSSAVMMMYSIIIVIVTHIAVVHISAFWLHLPNVLTMSVSYVTFSIGATWNTVLPALHRRSAAWPWQVSTSTSTSCSHTRAASPRRLRDHAA